MKFRLLDRIMNCDATRLAAVKAISFEEFDLLAPWGRRGVFPESLILQTAVEAAGVLLAIQSGFASFGVLSEIAEARFHRGTEPGDVLRIEVRAEERCGGEFSFVIAIGDDLLADGRVRLVGLPLESCYGDRDSFRRRLEELGGQVA